MVSCPAGHDSASDDYCDVCGARIHGAPAAPTGTAPPPVSCGGVPHGEDRLYVAHNG